MNFNRIVNIDFHRCAVGLWRGRFFVTLMACLGLAAGIVAAVFFVPKENEYTATASVYCAAYGSYSESVNGTNVIRTYSGIIKSHRVADRAAMLIADPNITGDDVYEQIEVDSLYVRGTTYVYESDTPIITMHAVSEDEYIAVSIVNAVADAFVQEANSLSTAEAIQVLDYAYEGELTYNALQTRILVMLIAIICGIFAGCIIILMRVLFTDRVVTVNDAGLYGQLNVVGIIPRFESSRRT